MTDLLTACSADLAPGPLGGELLRMVESQQQVATLSLVDDLTEQNLLEELLESAKPPLRPGTEGLHYLLAAPFRYPPLRHGSRFGGRFEPALFYGAKRLPTLLAEAAYYRFVFWSGMAEAPPAGRLLTQHSVFRARWRTDRGLRLQTPPCDAHEAALRHPSDYGPTQRLGRALREMGIGAFEYRSARDADGGINTALFEPAALVSRKPLGLQQWFCETRADAAVFSPAAGSALHRFARDDFLVDGRLPRPAA
ncbi:MAG: RES family NAD+ phosphorylase [Thiohalocapsa sp.]|jgi:hypothetical protein|nr:RES family NAD+ phosphorylase [Thiohalocapsa sp.]